MKKIFYLFLAVLLITGACKKEKDDINTYQVKTVELYPSASNKTKAKTNEQYISILYANLFQKALSANQVIAISQCMESIGDQQLAKEVIISNFMNKPGVIIPADTIMQADIDKFIVETYKRFLVRNPSEAEKTYFRNMISSDPNITAEIVYFSFALSDEYAYY
jgi:hypothetical protein